MEIHRQHKDEIAAVIMDMSLPKLSGWDAFLSMKDSQPEITGATFAGNPRSHWSPRAIARRLIQHMLVVLLYLCEIRWRHKINRFKSLGKTKDATVKAELDRLTAAL